jgi:aryl-alcohol dehydrogenase-like predicted oxidoreductase
LTRVILGCGNFGGIGSDLSVVGAGDDEHTAFTLMDAAWERGVRRFDTASSYAGGESERIIGRWLASRRPDGLRITSKVFNPVTADDDAGLAPARVRRVARESVERLGVERLDLLLAHEWDPETPIAETFGAFEELVADGVVAEYGVSNVNGEQLRAALAAGRVAVVQNEYSLLVRDSEAEVLPLCAAHGIRFQAFSPLAGGWLTGKYRRGEPFPAGSRMALRPDDRMVRDAVYDTVATLAARGDPARQAYAWLFANRQVDGVVVGPRTLGQLELAFAALEEADAWRS